MSDQYTTFLADLTPEQTRALASQVGIDGALSVPVSKLYNLLLDSDQAMEIHEEVFGG